MLLSDFQFELPQELIAQQPLPERDASRMLLLRRQEQAWQDDQFRSLPDLLRGNELIVVNNARVIPARLFGRREGVRSEKPGRNRRTAREFLSSQIEVLLTREIAPHEWEALVRPGRKIRVGERIEFGEGDLTAEVVGRGEYGERRIRLTAKGDVSQAIERLGHVPLPPYISRQDRPEDRERYQTIFADHPGAVAAPTAGLHFSPAILEKLRSEEHTSELQSPVHLVCRLLLEKKKLRPAPPAPDPVFRQRSHRRGAARVHRCLAPARLPLPRRAL